MTNISENSIKYFANTTNTQHQKNKTLNLTAIHPYIKTSLFEGEKATKEKQDALNYYNAINENVPNDFSNYTASSKKLDEFAFIFPIEKYHISSGFGYRASSGRNHDGVDFDHPIGTKVMASESGNIIATGYTKGYGGYGEVVVIEHSKSIKTLYAHLNTGSIKVKVGQYVQRGSVIAGVGQTGLGTGPHLHFEIRVNNKPINPIPYLGVNNSKSSTNIIEVKNLIIHHSAGGSHETAEDIKRYHLSKKSWNDIGYHMIIESDGKIVRGRADDVQGAQALGANEWSLGVCLIGNFMKKRPTNAQINSLVTVLATWCKKFNLDVSQIIGHKKVAELYNRVDASTACPGDTLDALIPEIRKMVKAKLLK